MLVRPDELKCLIKYARKAKLGIVEIGTYDGETASRLATNSLVNIFSIDPVIPDYDSGRVGDEESILRYTKDLPNHVFIKDFSYKVVLTWDKDFDFIFIDGDHRYEAVKRDFEDWFPLLAEDGYLAFHDSGANRGGPEKWPGPSRFTDELMALNENVLYIETVQSLTVFKKQKK